MGGRIVYCTANSYCVVEGTELWLRQLGVGRFAPIRSSTFVPAPSMVT